MQRKKNDVKARTTLLLSLPDEHQNDLDTMSLDDLYNHLKVYEAEVQKKSNSNSQNMAFISSSKHSSGDEDGNTACVPITSTTVPTASASVATISQDTASTYIDSQSSGSQIKFKDINQIDEDDMEEIDIKWSMVLLSIRADKFWKKTRNKISIQGSDVAGFDKSKVECFNCHKMGHFAREKDNYRQGSKAEEKTPKALMAIDGVGWDWSYMANEVEDHALITDAEAPTEFALMANTETKLETRKLEKDGVDGKLAGLLKASKNLDNLIESHRSDKVKDEVRYNDVPPPATDLYLSPKKDLSWTGLPEFIDDIVTDYSRLVPTVESTSEEGLDFVMTKKACFNCGDFSYLANDCRKKVAEHYALWEVIEFGDSYKVPSTTDPNNTTTTRNNDEKSGRIVTITTEDMQRKKNDAAILKTFGGNEAIKKRKKNLLKQQYGNFKAEGSETLEQTFNRFLAPEWPMHTIVWRNKNDLDTMSLDDLYNHLKVYEAEVQKKSNSNSQNMAFIFSSKHSSGDEDGNTACVPTASTTVPTASASIDEDDMEEIDIKWSMALLSIRADKFWKKTRKKISIQGSDVAGFDKSKVKCFNCHKMGHFARECRAPRSQERGRKDNYRQGSKAEEKTLKALMAIDGLETLKLEKDGVDGKLVGLLKASKNLDNLIESHRPMPTVESTLEEGQNKHSSTFKDVASSITPKLFVKFVKPKDTQSEKNKKETPNTY
nr:hypothetical protein [Tanacetum cinerariifolium]